MLALESGAGKMSQQVKVPVTMSDNQSSIPEPHIDEEGANQFS